VGDNCLFPRLALPIQFVAVANFPALVAGLLAGLPIDACWRGLPEWVVLSPTLLFIVLLWYWIGHWFDRCWSWTDGPPSTQKYPWIVLLLFTLLCAGGANVEIGSTSDYLLSGALIWIVAGCVFAGSALHSKLRRPVDA